MTDLPDPGTDPIPEGGDEPYGFWATLFGLPLLERRLLKRIEQLITTPADTAALEDSLVKLRAADTTVDNIEPADPFVGSLAADDERIIKPEYIEKGTNP